MIEVSELNLEWYTESNGKTKLVSNTNVQSTLLDKNIQCMVQISGNYVHIMLPETVRRYYKHCKCNFNKITSGESGILVEDIDKVDENGITWLFEKFARKILAIEQEYLSRKSTDES